MIDVEDRDEGWMVLEMGSEDALRAKRCWTVGGSTDGGTDEENQPGRRRRKMKTAGLVRATTTFRVHRMPRDYSDLGHSHSQSKGETSHRYQATRHLST